MVAGEERRAALHRQHRSRLRFGLVNLDVLLNRMNETFPEIARRYGFFRDFAERNDGVLVPLRIDGRGAAIGYGARAMGGQENELETVRNLIDAIFDGHAGHAQRFLYERVIETIRAGCQHRFIYDRKTHFA